MDFRSIMDQVKSAFVIGKDNTYLHGGTRRETRGSYDPQQNSAPQEDYAQNYQGYQSPYQQPANPYGDQQQAWQQPAQQADPYSQMQGQAYGYPQGQAAPQQQNYQQQYSGQQANPAQYGYAPPEQQPSRQQASARPAGGFETQMDPYAQDANRNRRSRQHQDVRQSDPVYNQPDAAQNIVQFPGSIPPPQQETAGGGIDAYVINVFNISSCRQAMSCLRRGQCTLIVMDQLVDKAEIRRYVDMLTGACYALNGTMTRLSSKIGFYIMAPSGMTVYTDPTTSNANTPPQPKPPQAPLYQVPTGQPYAGTRPMNDFSQQSAYPQAPQMNFSAHQQQAQPQQEPYPQHDQQTGYASSQTDTQAWAQ